MKLAGSLLAGVAVLGLVPITAAPARSSGAVQADRFVPPAGKLVLSRTVIRVLSDGKQIVVTRRYRISFLPTSSGYQLDGTLIDVDVQVPPLLTNLADIERIRPDTGLFPMQLGIDGMIRDQHTEILDSKSRQENFAKAGAFLTQNDADPQRRSESIRQLGRLVGSMPNSAWPTDLFRAQPGERRMERQVTLSDGRQGIVEVVLKVETLLPCGLPQRLERVVTTRLGGSTQVSKEVFAFDLTPG